MTNQNSFFHLTSKQAWEEAKIVGSYSLSTKGKTLEEVGFLHASFADQLDQVAQYVFTGSTEALVVLHLDIEKLENNGITVKVEAASNGQLYPHIYGAIPCHLVDKIIPASMNSEGKLQTP